jgi:hypothetical protein
MTTPFLAWHYPTEVLQKRANIIRDLVRYVRKGLEPQYGEVKVPDYFKTYEKEVDALLLSYFTSGVTGAGKHKVETGNTIDLLAEAFEDAKKTNGFKNLATPLLSSDLLKSFEVKTGTSYISYDFEAKPTVLGAYEAAVLNGRQTETRLTALTLIETLIKPSRFYSLHIDGKSQVRDALWDKRRGYLRDELLFGTLSGGETAKKVLKHLVEETCYDPESHIRYSLIQFLTADGGIPSFTRGSYESDFLADIKEKYDALG